MIGCCFSRSAPAQQRGAIGGALSAGLGVVDGAGAFTLGASGWYRLIPALALGVNVGSTGVNGAEQHGLEIVRYSVVEGFVEGRAFPSSAAGVFGRISAGVSHLTLLSPSTGELYEVERNEPILELEGGPELRLFFAPSTTRARPELFFRVCGILTTMSAATFPGFGVGLGFEG